MDMSKSGVIKPQKLDSLRPINSRNFFQWKTVLEAFLKTNVGNKKFRKLNPKPKEKYETETNRG